MNYCDTNDCSEYEEEALWHCLADKDCRSCIKCTAYTSVPINQIKVPVVNLDKCHCGVCDNCRTVGDDHITRSDILASHKEIEKEIGNHFDKKFDQGKPRFDLLDPYFEEELAQVLEYGTRKYDENSWQDVPNALARYIAAMKRHLNAIQKGELIDGGPKGSGLPHHAHAAANMMFISYFTRLLMENEDNGNN